MKWSRLRAVQPPAKAKQVAEQQKPDTDPIVLNYIDPSSEWVEETRRAEFYADDLEWMGWDDDP